MPRNATLLDIEFIEHIANTRMLRLGEKIRLTDSEISAFAKLTLYPFAPDSVEHYNQLLDGAAYYYTDACELEKASECLALKITD